MKKTNKISLLLCLLLAISLLALTSCDLLDGILGEVTTDQPETTNETANETANEATDQPSENSDQVEEEADPIAVDFLTDDHVTVYVYETQDMTGEGNAATTAYARDGETGAILSNGTGQVNFLLVFDEGYQLDAIVVDNAENYNKIKGEADTGVKNGYRVTKISGELTVTITSVEKTEEISGYAVGFDYDTTIEGLAILVFDTQTAEDGKIYTADESFYAKTSIGTISKTGEEQVNFSVVLPEGYEITSVTATEGVYKNIKTIDATTYRVTKITGDITITVTIAQTAA